MPPAYDIANLVPARIGFRTAGALTAAIGFVVGALWVAAIDSAGLPLFVDTLGVVPAPLYGIMIVGHYLLRRQRLDVQALCSGVPGGAYHHTRGWNARALVAVARVFSVATVWVPALAVLSGFAWVVGAVVGGALHLLVMRGGPLVTGDAAL